MLQVDNDPIILGPGNPLSAAALTGVAAPTSETKASYIIQTALKLEAKALGILGNAVTVKAEANTSDNLAVSVTGNALTILLANATGSKNTMTLIAAAIVASTPANALVNAIVITGATQMTAFTVQNLSGGVNGSVGYRGEVRYDVNGTEWKMKYTTAGCYYWSPDGFPANDTSYIVSVNGNTATYKRRIITTSPPGNASSRDIDIMEPVWNMISAIGTLQYTASLKVQFPQLYATTNNGVTMSITQAANLLQIICIIASAPYFNKPVVIDLIYEKAV